MTEATSAMPPALRIAKLAQFETLRAAMSPNTRDMLDACGFTVRPSKWLFARIVDRLTLGGWQ